MSKENVLVKETEYFKQNKQQYLKIYAGQFVLIKGNQLIGSFTTEAEAYKAAVGRFGNQPFLIMRVNEQEQAVSIPALTIGVINVSIQ